jgi:hypothetical protein
VDFHLRERAGVTQHIHGPYYVFLAELRTADQGIVPATPSATTAAPFDTLLARLEDGTAKEDIRKSATDIVAG